MALDPSIALGVKPIELPNQLAQYGQLAAIQNAQNQNALAQYQLSSAQRTDQQQNALNQAYSSSVDPLTGKIDYGKVSAALAAGGAGSQIPAAQKHQFETQQAEATLNKTTAETKASEFKLSNDKLSHGWKSLGEASTPQAAIEKLKDGVKQGYFDEPTARKEAELIQNMTIDQYKQYRMQKIMGLLDAKDQLEQTKIITKDIDRGGFIERQTYDAQGKPVGAPVRLEKTATIGEKTAQGQLSLAQKQFEFRKNNPGYELREDPEGIFAVNKDTLKVVPVMVGGNGVPTMVAPTPAAGAGMPGARTAPPAAGAVPAVGGAVAPAAGTPVAGAPRQLMGKGKEAPAKFHDIDIQLSGLAGSLKSFKDEIKNDPTTGAPFLPKGADTARMQAKYTSLLMGLKDLYTLGALTGPDMSIIESQINNPASWSGKLTSYAGIKEQTKVIEDMLNRSAQNVESSYERKPKATAKALEQLNLLPGASATDPLGLGVRR